MSIEDSIVCYAAPTLAGIKTGNMFCCAYENRYTVQAQLRELNRRLSGKGICVIPLRYSEKDEKNKKVLLYIYRPSYLAADLQQEEARQILSGIGYSCTQCGACIRRLVERINEGTEFPHEVGLFLSYPPEDVRGFIENKAENYKCIGCWKVYGDESAAVKTFDKYKKCTEDYCRIRKTGVCLEKLAVAG